MASPGLCTDNNVRSDGDFPRSGDRWDGDKVPHKPPTQGQTRSPLKMLKLYGDSWCPPPSPYHKAGQSNNRDRPKTDLTSRSLTENSRRNIPL
jgi:hypothetical protein